ncbi:SPT3 Dosage dependent suppressor of Ty-induced promoter mutations-like protein [Mortierella alpina]|uniref:SPT3 Dosage dependent suppressor of Ty-induced promoter mutations-like protein n=1 Tax=Mortierella alpina TaxID=64518 RepID=A0A9P6IU97_MORAP|nr:SPT3 Dosage dependent suppressor of Ty-induced promoter mutations-like protein [Mortierella alpina]
MSQNGFRVNITGIPLQGAKSRVETQIKLGIQLVNQQNERVGAWTHIKLPEYMVAKEKNKRINAKNVVGPITQLDEDDPEQIALEQRKILLFNCTEIAEFNSGELILPTRITCYCRHHSEKQGFCIQFMLRDYANNIVAMGMSPPIMITDDHKASKVKKPEQGATGTQRKTTTTKKPTEGASKVITLTPPSSPTTPGDEVESEVDMGTGQDDDDEEEEESEESEMDSASSNASPSPLQATMDINHYNPNNMSIVDLISQFSQGDDARQVPSPSSPLTPGDRMSQACQTTPASEYPPTSFEGQQQFQSMNSFIYASNNDRMVPEQLVDIPISLATPSSTSMDQLRDHVSQQHQLQQEHERQQQQHQQQQLQQQHLQFQQLQQQALFPDSFNNPAAVTPAPIGRRTSTSGGVGPVRRRRAPAAANPLTSSATQPAMSASMTTNPLAATASMLSPSPLPSLLGLSSSLAMVPPGFILPRMTRLIPNSGPCFGGIEITVLGANFYAGLTAMFDSTPALPTQFWSPNTLICILPPRIQPGTTVVTFKEHPSITLPQAGDSSELMLFTYVDESDKALMELALQVVGLKMTGRLEDARNIALRIVGSQVANGQQQQGQQQGQGQGQGQQQNTMSYANLVRDLILSFGDQETDSEFQAGLEDRILTLLTVLSELPDGGQDVLNLARRDTGHRLLHFGAMKGFERLVEVLVSHTDIEVDALDMNGYSALHYACWRGEVRSASLLVGKGADVMLRSVHGVGCLDLAGMNPPTTAADLVQALKTSNSWVDAGAQEADGYESAQEAEGDSEVDEELEALDALEDGEDSGVWLEHFATESDVLEEEDESEDSFDATSLVGSEIEDLPWLDKGEWIGEDVSDSSQWSGSDAGKNENECEKEECSQTTNGKPGVADIVQAPSSPSLIPMATPLPQDPKDAQAAEMGTNWLQKTLFQLQSSSPAFDFEFFKALNQILPEKGNFLMNMPSMPTSIQAFNANIGTYMPYNFSGKHEIATTDAAAQPVSEKQVYVHQRSGSIGEPILDEQAISHELWTLHSGPDGRLMNNNVTAAPTSAAASAPEEAPSRYLNVYHEPFSATSVLQQPVNSYALPAQDSTYNPLTLTTAPLPNTHGGATVTSPLSKVRRFYPPMGSEPQQPAPASDVGESSVVRGGRRIITEIVNNGAVVGGAAVAERAVEAVGENRHIQELRARYHQKMKRLKKDKMLFLFWVPVLLVMLALTIIRIASTFDVARQWTGGLMNLAGIQV